MSVDELPDENSSRETDESEYDLCMPKDDLPDRDGYMADPASDVDSPRSALMPVGDIHVRWQP